MYFYPRSPCGERRPFQVPPQCLYHISIHALLAESDHGFDCPFQNEKVISIHALLAESDAAYRVCNSQSYTFLSTLSLRRATRYRYRPQRRLKISIHALLAESDKLREFKYELIAISIHALLAESDVERVSGISVPPNISIHALLAESDRKND